MYHPVHESQINIDHTEYYGIFHYINFSIRNYTMSDQSLWILGYGTLPVSKQFLLDLHRIPTITLNNVPLPANIYQAVRLLYDICGIHYYHYSKYMNQTMGNMMIEYIQKAYNNHAIPYMNSYEVHGTYTPVNKSIRATMCVKIYNHQLVHLDTIRACCVYDITSVNRTISLYKI